jgi:hypothetical protein
VRPRGYAEDPAAIVPAMRPKTAPFMTEVDPV